MPTSPRQVGSPPHPDERYIPRRGGYQPPAPQRFQPSRLNGMHPSGNVGGDAHIAPSGWVHPHARLNGEMSIYPVPFNVQGCRVRVRVDAGIDPYIETIHACHSTHSSVSIGFGRLVAAPTVDVQNFPVSSAKALPGGSGHQRIRTTLKRQKRDSTSRFPPRKRYRAGQGTNVFVPS